VKERDQKIIIKKVIKSDDENEHGGQWKVAYADFVTALMAFFLMLWLITMIAPEKRARVASYFKYFSIFPQSGQSFIDKSSEIFNEAGESPRKVPQELQGSFNMKPEEFKETLKNAIEGKLGDIKDQILVDIFEGGVRIQLVDKDGKAMFDLGSSKPTPNALRILQVIADNIKSMPNLLAIEGKLGDIKDQILVDIFEGGVRIQLVDKDGKAMFDLGSSKPTPNALRILQVIADNIKSMPNLLAIEGHTDSLTYSTSYYSNWELSTERALTARKELEQYGVDPNRLTRVAGYADTVPLIKENTKDPRNRRISIILMFPTHNQGSSPSS
jgi:chemotaxis protein MotB